MRAFRCRVEPWLAGMLLSLLLPMAWAADQGEEAVLARVGQTTISLGEFEARFQAGLRQRFYHGQVPDEQLAEYRQTLLQSMIDRLLLVAEARRQGLDSDPERVEKAVARISRRYESSPLWQQRGEQLRVSLRQGLMVDDLVDQLRQRLHASAAEPTEEALRDYYARHPDQFTTPQRLRVSLILLKVDPWAPESAWQAAIAEAGRLRQQIEDGQDFAELARLHSADGSASQGGDLGFLHRGMLAPEAEKIVDTLRPGQVSQPLRLLQGIALFRLQERQPARLNPFDKARQRVAELFQREQRQRLWQGLLARLRAATTVAVDHRLLVEVGR